MILGVKEKKDPRQFLFFFLKRIFCHCEKSFIVRVFEVLEEEYVEVEDCTMLLLIIRPIFDRNANETFLL